MNPAKSGYADVNGIKLYHEIYGAGEPLVLIHGGLTTIGEMQGWVEPLAKTWQVASPPRCKATAAAGLVSGGAAGHEPGRQDDGRKHDADADGQVFEAM